MNISKEDLLKITKLTSQQIEYVTCDVCCKLYIAPETAPCGHTLCHWCWRERLTCPRCAKPIDRSTLRLNQSIQIFKENVLTLVESYKKKIKVAEVLLDQDFKGKAKAKILEPKKVVYVPTVPQDDWDKIEPLPDTEGVSKKDKENVIGPMDIEPFCTLQNVDENQYTSNNPRRSSRKRELKPTNENNNKKFVKQNSNQTNISKVPFYKKSTLNPSNSRIPTEDNIMNTMNQIVESNSKSNDDIEITIKVANIAANVLIKRQANMELKLNTDRETQMEPAPSEVLVSTAKIRSRTQKSCEKRCRGGEDDTSPTPKKAKWGESISTTTKSAEKNESEHVEPDSEPITYDAKMRTVFANIDAEIGESLHYSCNSVEDEICQNKRAKKPTHIEITPEVDLPTVDNVHTLRKVHTKDSAILFTNSVGRDDSEVTVPLASLAEKVPHEVATSIAGELLTPVMCEPLDEDVEMANIASLDKSVVQETPHKSSFTKVKKSNGPKRDNKNVTHTQEKELQTQKQLSKPETEDITSIDSISDTFIRSVANETAIWKPASETPLTIVRFVNQIPHKSNPVAKKSLNSDTQNDDVILCDTSEGVENTNQERKFMLKAFEKPLTTVVKPTVKSLTLNHKEYVIAGSSLDSREIETLKRLCDQNNWSYANQYTSEVTHLVVKGDEKNKARRTLKVLRALAASKWIISYEWVTKCMQSKEPVKEEDFELLVSTRYPGPKKARLATRKLYEGIKFFCQGPFTSIETNILQEIITSSGGTVVDSMKAVRVLGECSPALLLAEPEHTQVDHFSYIAMEQNIVPVHFMWVLDCLGRYTLHSILKLLLCSPTLLPKPTQHWPKVLLDGEGHDQ